MKVPHFRLMSGRTILVLPKDLIICLNRNGEVISVVRKEDQPKDDRVQQLDDVEITERTLEVAEVLVSLEEELVTLLPKNLAA